MMPSSIVSLLESSQQINGGQVPDAIEAGRRRRSHRRRSMRGGAEVAAPAAPVAVEGGAAIEAGRRRRSHHRRSMRGGAEVDAPAAPVAVEGGAVDGGFFFDNVEGGKRAYKRRAATGRALSRLFRSKKCPKGSRKDTRKGKHGSCRKTFSNGRFVSARKRKMAGGSPSA